MIKNVCLGLLLLLPLSLSSCYTMTHKSGSGGSGSTVVAERQWWALWGLIPINHIDSSTLAAGSTDYTVKTEFTPIDVLITFFTWFVTVSVQTVEVQK